ncbi:MAG: nitroreductase family protein [Candidatus Krumholzibacteriota bacterium]|nr:nitroreductase family protein [Candidatus Krumholzibacteriota bacterium]
MERLTKRQLVASLARILAARPRAPRSVAGNPLLRTILERRTRRRFRDEDVAPDEREAILEAGRLAPSTVNLQTWTFLPFDREQWRRTFSRPLPLGAPWAVMILADTRRARRAFEFPAAPLCDHTVGVMNASLAAMSMVLAAEALGLGSCLLSETGKTGFYDAAELADVLVLPAGVLPLVTAVFGRPLSGRPRPVMPPKLPVEAVAPAGGYRDADAAVLAAWRRQMQAGYQAATGGRSFAGQLAHYARRIGEAEAGLRRLVLGDGPDAAAGGRGKGL